MNDISPAVERAIAAAEQRAGLTPLRLAHLLLGLLDDDEGRPAVILAALGHSIDTLRNSLENAIPGSPPAPPVRRIMNAAREWSMEHRADPNVLTDAFLLAILRLDPSHVETLGLSLESVRAQIEPRHAEPVAVQSSVASAEFQLPSSVFLLVRILDVNLNRARESLRVLDDYARFVLDDRFFTERCKHLRHRLAELTSLLPANLLASRETQQDVGTGVTAAGEYQRSSASDVAAVNLKRLQESLRSLEEFGKVLNPGFAQGIEQMRYDVYTLERALIRGLPSRDRLANARLYVLLSGESTRLGLEETIRAAAAGGADVIQLREKGLADHTLLERARSVRRWTREVGVLFIVNDRPDIAHLADADGVHLGQDDLPVHAARRLLGPDGIIGVSTHSLDQVRKAILDGADYLGVGPTFPSATKSFDQFPGLEFVSAAMAETSLPAFALGGIHAGTIDEAIAAGARRVAVSAAITNADNPEQAARQLRESLTLESTPGQGL